MQAWGVSEQVNEAKSEAALRRQVAGWVRERLAECQDQFFEVQELLRLVEEWEKNGVVVDGLNQQGRVVRMKLDKERASVSGGSQGIL